MIYFLLICYCHFNQHFPGKFEHHENLDKKLPATMLKMKASTRQIGG